MNPDRFFTQGEVNKIFHHISTRTIRFWMESGLVRWASECQNRRGIHRLYNIGNLWQLGVVEELMDLNFNTPLVQTFMLTLESLDNKHWKDHSLLILKATNQNHYHAAIILSNSVGEILKKEFANGRRVAIVVNLQKVSERVNSRLEFL